MQYFYTKSISFFKKLFINDTILEITHTHTYTHILVIFTISLKKSKDIEVLLDFVKAFNTINYSLFI